jgi:hypothetical protein
MMKFITNKKATKNATYCADKGKSAQELGIELVL